MVVLKKYDSRDYVSAIAQNDLDRTKPQTPNNIFKIDDSHIFPRQVANGQSEKLLVTTSIKVDIGDNTFADHYVLMQNLTTPIIGLHFMRHNKVVINMARGVLRFPNLTIQVTGAATELSTKPQAVHADTLLTTPPRTTKTITVFVRITVIRMEHSRHCEPTREIYGNSRFADFTFNIAINL